MRKGYMEVWLPAELREAVEQRAHECEDNVSDTCARLIRLGLAWEPARKLNAGTGDRCKGTRKFLLALPTSLHEMLEVESRRWGWTKAAVIRETLWEWADAHCHGDAQSSEEKQR